MRKSVDVSNTEPYVGILEVLRRMYCYVKLSFLPDYIIKHNCVDPASEYLSRLKLNINASAGTFVQKLETANFFITMQTVVISEMEIEEQSVSIGEKWRFYGIFGTLVLAGFCRSDFPPKM